MPSTFTCAQCGETFDKTRGEADALAEAFETFGKVNPRDLVVVCEDCYREFMGQGT